MRNASPACPDACRMRRQSKGGGMLPLLASRAPAGAARLFLRAEPTLALALRYPGPAVILLSRNVIDALALRRDVALDFATRPATSRETPAGCPHCRVAQPATPTVPGFRPRYLAAPVVLPSGEWHGLRCCSAVSRAHDRSRPTRPGYWRPQPARSRQHSGRTGPN